MIDFQEFIESFDPTRRFRIQVVDGGGNLIDVVEIEAGPEEGYVNIGLSKTPDPRALENVKVGFGQKPYSGE
jgi:hypothetical protein